jgi:hypothetical protein
MLCHEGSKPKLWNQKRRPLLGNGSILAFPQQPSHVTATSQHAIIVEPLEAVFSAGSAPRLAASPVNFQGDSDYLLI